MDVLENRREIDLDRRVVLVADGLEDVLEVAREIRLQFEIETRLG